MLLSEYRCFHKVTSASSIIYNFIVELRGKTVYNASMYTKKTTSSKQSQELQYTNIKAQRGNTASTGKKSTTQASAPKSSKAPLSDEEKARRAAKRRAAAKKKKQQQQRRVLLASLLFLLAAIAVLVWSICFLINKQNGDSIDLPNPSPSASASASANPDNPDASNQAGTALQDDATLPSNASINGISVGGQTVAQARSTITSQLEASLNGIAITLQTESFTHTLTREELGAAYDVEAGLSLAMSGGSVTAPLSYDETTLLNTLYALNDQLPGHATNATVSVGTETYSVGDKTSGYKEYNKPSFTYTEGTDGMQLDYDSILSQIGEVFSSGTLQTTLTPQVTVSKPAVTVETLKKQTTKLADFSTDYYFTKSGSSTTEEELTRRQNRDSNISKAAGLMNVIKLEPGETFSFNKTTGERSESRGWALAPAVYRGSHRAEPGGGVCQVSTTMFNALLRCGVDITYHKEHSLPSDYVDEGMDATVNYGTIDFKFKNNKSGTLYVFVYITKCSSSSHKKTIHVEVYGPEEPGVEYKVTNTCVGEDPAVNPTTKPNKKETTDYAEVIQKAYDGSSWQIQVYRIENGNKTLVYDYTAVYDKIEQVTEVGTKETPSPSPKTTPKPDTSSGEEEGGDSGGEE